mmetsp:Transcript_55242/g.131694  ORF Transcript_55242/g.131694 Transcript_55242/m.131694 type:complete len:204 (+) Transcript_55242:58-669(+)
MAQSKRSSKSGSLSASFFASGTGSSFLGGGASSSSLGSTFLGSAAFFSGFGNGFGKLISGSLKLGASSFGASGILISGALKSGVLKSGALKSGALNSGVLKSGALNSGTLKSGALNSGALNSGSLMSAGVGNWSWLPLLLPAVRTPETTTDPSSSRLARYDKPSAKPKRPNGPAGRPRPRCKKLPSDHSTKPKFTAHATYSMP